MTNRAFLVVTTTQDAEEKARVLADAVVRERLAACAQVYPIQSVYWWDGDVRNETEWRIDFKTSAELAEAVTEFIKAHHSYDTPEVITVPIASGDPAYLEWVAAETKSP
ncbi:divalent-cation tolerance protein CutA [Microbispora sp. NBC_01189]|uniref:divalent-cation tolerance protein CutA n=1 Tax=unclassified Microbispora TaxID=2614687 RepID=UPI002E1149BA|nr:divalent-cation tolerance protein CutA [Microbispora sp. NBC_01189]